MACVGGTLNLRPYSRVNIMCVRWTCTNPWYSSFHFNVYSNHQVMIHQTILMRISVKLIHSSRSLSPLSARYGGDWTAFS